MSQITKEEKVRLPIMSARGLQEQNLVSVQVHKGPTETSQLGFLAACSSELTLKLLFPGSCGHVSISANSSNRGKVKVMLKCAVWRKINNLLPNLC